MEYRITDIARILGGEASLPCPEASVGVLLTDSRSLAWPAESLFFAIHTATGDGHRYISDLYSRGVRNFVVARGHEPDVPADANVIAVADTTAALQELARHHRHRFDDLPVIGITGSQGKTTVKEWLYALLHDDCRIARSPRSYNSRIGVPLSVWEIDSHTDMAILEAGVSREGEMAVLAPMVCPTMAVITNIGAEHDEGFASRTEKAREKAQLACNADTAVWPADDADIAGAMKEFKGRSMAWSRLDSEAPLWISAVECGASSTRIVYTCNATAASGTLTIPFTSLSDVENAISCLAVMLALGKSPEATAERIGRLTPVATRLEVVEGVNGCLVVNDAYTSDFHSLEPALDFMQRRATDTRTSTVILSDLMHETLGADTIYADTARLLRQRGISRVIGIGPEISAHAGLFGPDARFYSSTEAFLDATTTDDFHQELILVKGAAAFGFERITERLEGRLHETVLEVNLDAMVRNYNYFRSLLHESTGIVCMVKAFGYGAGSYELAKTLQSQGAAYLAVAAHDEGVDLRKAGITMPIMVLNPKVVDYGALFEYNLEPEIYSLPLLRDIIAEARRRGVKNYPVHIKLDTGMHRLGFLYEELPAVADLLASQDAVVPHSIFSHLSCAEDPLEDDYTQSQFDYFDRCCDYFLSRFPDRHILRHILNSAGIVRFPERQYDMARLGIGLYGIRTMPPAIEAPLERVSSLHTVIISIREWPAGTTIGYNRRGVLDRESRIATIPIGYADGIDRHLGYGNLKVAVNGCLCPTVGSICMDVAMIDVTDVPSCRVGDRVEIFGDAVPTEDVAERISTIPYEILTSVSTRVKRIYYRE